MARAHTITTIVTDDLTGEALDQDIAKTVQFALDGTHYEIDLSADNASSLRNDFAAWAGHARKTTPGGSRRTRTTTGPMATSTSTDRQQSATILERKTGCRACSPRGTAHPTPVRARGPTPTQRRPTPFSLIRPPAAGRCCCGGC